MGSCVSKDKKGRMLSGEETDEPARPRSAKSFFFLVGKMESNEDDPTDEEVLAEDANEAPLKPKTGSSFFYYAYGGRAGLKSFKALPPEETKMETITEEAPKKEHQEQRRSSLDQEDNFGRHKGTSLDGKSSPPACALCTRLS
jgi:hypothetical protein